MFQFLRVHQLNTMLLLCGACGILAFLLLITRFLSTKRKWTLVLMELVALFLLWFDRLAYVYSGDTTSKGYVMTRISNCIVFMMTPAVVLGFNLYLGTYLSEEGKMEVLPKRLRYVGAFSSMAILLALFSSFVNLYYYFDASNHYHRGKWFLVAYIIPIICPLVQYSVIREYRKIFSDLIYISMNLFLFVPIVLAIIQIFAYGLSLVNMGMCVVSITLYIFTYLDINNTVNRAHEIEILHMQGEQLRMKRLFDQTAKAFVSAVEKKDDFTEGNSVKIAEYARKIAKNAGKNDEDCDKAYYTALLHDVGMIGIPDAVIKNDTDPGAYDYETIRKKPLIGKEILSNITEYPYLSLGAAYSHERYNGTGYPEGLKGDEIPDIARIVAVADAYVTMTTPKRYRAAKPDFIAREAFVKGAGVEFDPIYASIMVTLIDSENKEKNHDDIALVEKELVCGEYRDTVSLGIPTTVYVTNISFNCELQGVSEGIFSAPSIILFDSFDRRVHDDEKTIKAYNYLEYGEIWFDNHSITTAARKIVETILEPEPVTEENKDKYTIISEKYDDHMRLTMISPGFKKEVIIALQDGSTSVYIGITGEHCAIHNIEIDLLEDKVGPEDIPRISDEISYINHMESDIPNIQINQTRSASTEGIELNSKLELQFHTMSMPVANFVWHCPYVVIFSSDNGRVQGRNYHEYALIKINGETDSMKEYAENSFVMKRKDSFPGWDTWKSANKEGIDCEIKIERKGNKVVTTTENLGVYIENTTSIYESPEKVYVALTGDRCAITDIRIM